MLKNRVITCASVAFYGIKRRQFLIAVNVTLFITTHIHRHMARGAGGNSHWSNHGMYGGITPLKGNYYGKRVNA